MILLICGCTEVFFFVVNGKIVDYDGKPEKGCVVELDSINGKILAEVDEASEFELRFELTANDFTMKKSQVSLAITRLDGTKYSIDLSPKARPQKGTEEKVQLYVVLPKQ
jgi:hypothetical protein